MNLHMNEQSMIDLQMYYNLKGTFYQLITSQNGSRFMQKVYYNTDHSILEKIFLEIADKISQLMIDPYANYFCQKFFSVLNYANKIKFLNALTTNIESIANSKIGTYPLQSVIEQLQTDNEQLIILNAISGKILRLCQNSQGVHVIEKIVVCFNENLLEEIYTVIITNFIQLSTNSIGLFVCKKLIASAKLLNHLLQIRDVICTNSMMLIHNQYGNYTIQVAIESWPIEFSQPLIKSLFPFFITLSCQKYASNVIEKCLEKSKESLLIEFIDEIGKKSSMVSLITNSYGNFVLQTALKLAKGKNRNRLINCIKKCLEKINDKKLIKKWKGIITGSSHLTCGNMISNKSKTLNKSFDTEKNRTSLNSDRLNNSSSSNKSICSYKSTGDNDYNQRNMLVFNSYFAYPSSNCASPVHNSLGFPNLMMSPIQQSYYMNSPMNGFKSQKSQQCLGYNINFE